MPNLYDDLRRIIQEHKELERAVAANGYALGEILRNNLRHLSHGQLTDLKNQLRKYNIHTGRWVK